MNLRIAAGLALVSSTLLLNACGGGGNSSKGSSATPEQPIVPFAPSDNDIEDPVSHYDYPEPSLLGVRITYVKTTASGPGYYLVDENTCEYLDSPPASYPDDPSTPEADHLVTLDTVNLDVNDADECEPEIKVNFQADDYPVTSAYNAKMRMRGSSTRYANQKSYRVKLRSTHPCSTSTTYPCWRDEITLQFNKHPYDLARVRNKLAFDLMRDIPYLNSLRTQFAHIIYNDGSSDADMGLFTHVEKMGKEYLANRSYPTTSNLYKANEFHFADDDRLATDPAIAGSAFEEVLEVENDAGNHSALRAMIADINNEDIDFNTTFNRFFNRNNYLSWLATNILMGNHDTLTQNFALYQPAGSERFYFLPWDYDGALGFEDQPDVAEAGTFYDEWQLGLANWWGSPLHRRFIQQPGNLAHIKAAVKEIRDLYLLSTQVQARLDSYTTLVESLITTNPDVQHLPVVSGSPQTEAEQWAAEYQRLAQTVDTNYNRFLTLLESPMPFWQAANVDGDTLSLNWDAATDLQGDPVTYKVEVSADPAFGTLLYPVRNITTTSTSFSPAPAAGTYYMRVTARDSAGHITHAFDRTDIGDDRHFGVLTFDTP